MMGGEKLPKPVFQSLRQKTNECMNVCELKAKRKKKVLVDVEA